MKGHDMKKQTEKGRLRKFHILNAEKEEGVKIPKNFEDVISGSSLIFPSRL